MPKGQQRGNREPKKPKKPKKAEAVAAGPRPGQVPRSPDKGAAFNPGLPKR